MGDNQERRDLLRYRGGLIVALLYEFKYHKMSPTYLSISRSHDFEQVCSRKLTRPTNILRGRTKTTHDTDAR